MDLLIRFGAQYLYLGIPIIAIGVIVSEDKNLKKEIIYWAILIISVSYVLGYICSNVLPSPRPFLVSNVTPLVPKSFDNGFPSGHTLFSLAVASSIFVVKKKIGTLLIVLSLIVGIARVLAYAHHPIDIVGSIIIVSVAAIIASIVKTKLLTK